MIEFSKSKCASYAHATAISWISPPRYASLMHYALQSADGTVAFIRTNDDVAHAGPTTTLANSAGCS
jgi:hypothetical protein